VRHLARGLIDAGANLVVGHHPHVLQGIEYYGDGVIAYSLGNFVFTRATAIARLTGVLEVDVQLTEGGPDIRRVALEPAAIGRRDFMPRPVTARERRQVTRRMKDVSKRFKTRVETVGTQLRFLPPAPKQPKSRRRR
jgi:poly-gamma-glutamate synthesis protein (capsule biosynthesis protein)